MTDDGSRQVAVARRSLQNKRLRLAAVRSQFSPELGEGSVRVGLEGTRLRQVRDGREPRVRRPGAGRGEGDVGRASAKRLRGDPSGRARFRVRARAGAVGAGREARGPDRAPFSFDLEVS